MELKPVKGLKPFTRFLMTIGELPSSYLVSMTYEEQLLWFCNYLQNTVIPTVNNNAEAVIELQEFVTNYFENLDLQEEVDHKLDEMAESGELAEIIADYIQMNAVFVYDTIAAMAAAENLQDGASAYTLGKDTYNDGKGAFYKIRELSLSDVVDGYNIVAITNTDNLIGERLPDYEINALDGRLDTLEDTTIPGIQGDISDIEDKVDVRIIGFDTKADLKASEDLADGYFARTYGDTTLNDGICYFYKIREKEISEVTDDLNLLALTNYNDLVAERICEYIPNDNTNPIFFGADPTGTNDSTNAINNCILANKGGTVNFSSGNYKITNSINLPYKIAEQVNINGNGANLIVAANVTRAIYVGYDKGDEAAHDVGFPSYIKDLNINADGYSCTYGIDTKAGYKDLKVYNCIIYRVTNGVRLSDSTSISSDVLVKDCLLYGEGSEYDGAGCIVNGDDNNIVGCRIYGFRKGFVLNGAGVVDTCHVLLRWKDQTMQDFDPYERNSETFNTYYNQTMYAEVNNSTRFLGVYADSTYKFLEINTEAPIVVTGSTYYNARENCNCSMFNLNVNDPKLTINDTMLTVVKNTQGVVINTNGRFIGGSAQVNFRNISIVGMARMTNPCDLILTAFDDYHSNINMTTDTWYVIGVVANNPAYNTFSAKIYLNGFEYTTRFTFGSDSTPTGIAQQNRGIGDSSWTLGSLQVGNNCYICVKTSGSGDAKVAFEVKSMNRIFKLSPVDLNTVYSSNRALSEYTNLTPSTTLLLKNVLF